MTSITTNTFYLNKQGDLGIWNRKIRKFSVSYPF